MDVAHFPIKGDPVFNMRIWNHICSNIGASNDKNVDFASHQMCCKHRQAWTDSILQLVQEKTVQELLKTARVPKLAPILEPFWPTFPDSERLCCVFGLYAKPRLGNRSPPYHGGYSGYECPGYPKLWLYRDIYYIYQDACMCMVKPGIGPSDGQC